MTVGYRKKKEKENTHVISFVSTIRYIQVKHGRESLHCFLDSYQPAATFPIGGSVFVAAIAFGIET